MTQRTTSTPLDPLTQTEWRNTMAGFIGVAYASLSSNDQTELNRIIDEAHEYISERAKHFPWGKRKKTFTISTDSSGTDADSNQVYQMPADFRHEVAISETDGTTRWRCKVSDEEEYHTAADGSASHPWSNDSLRATWFFYGMSSDNPPVQEWVRVGGPTSGTITFIYRPYFGLVASGSNSYTVLPASEVSAIREHCRYKWKLYKNDYTGAAAHRQAREDDIAALEVADRQNSEEPLRLGFDSEFSNQLG